MKIFMDDADCLLYLRKLGKIVRAMEWNCLSYCLMENHVHLLLETPQANLSRGMQRLHGGYTQAFNGRHKRSGHLFQGRFGAVRIVSDEHLAAVTRYISQNPVEAGLCEHPQEWPWNSEYATTHRRRPDWLEVGRLGALLGSDPVASVSAANLNGV